MRKENDKPKYEAKPIGPRRGWPIIGNRVFDVFSRDKNGNTRTVIFGEVFRSKRSAIKEAKRRDSGESKDNTILKF